VVVPASPAGRLLQAREGWKQLKPTVLVATTSRWFPTARLAVALANAGCAVEAVCPPGHPITKTSVLRRTFTYRGLAPLKSLEHAITATNPAFLVSGDDLATWHLHCLYLAKQHLGDRGAAICSLIERSLGSPQHYPIVDDRAAFMQLSKEEGARIPHTVTIANSAALNSSLAQIGFPAVLKANGTSGGTGVKIAHNVDEAVHALKLLQAPPLIARAAKRAIFDHDRTLVLPALQRKRSKVTAQGFIKGHEATSAHACWKGAVLASLHFEVLQKSHASGHATVLRRIEHPEMTVTAEKMVRRLGLSGLHGFDFMLEADSRDAYLIEINPRATQVGHLSFGPGHDLPSALVSAVTNLPVSVAPKISENDTIALFPQEWLRDPASPFLRSGYHDVPWEEPELLRACIRKRGSAGLPLWLRKR
jgi:hypothetical protein